MTFLRWTISKQVYLYSSSHSLRFNNMDVNNCMSRETTIWFDSLIQFTWFYLVTKMLSQSSNAFLKGEVSTTIIIIFQKCEIIVICVLFKKVSGRRKTSICHVITDLWCVYFWANICFWVVSWPQFTPVRVWSQANVRTRRSSNISVMVQKEYLMISIILLIIACVLSFMILLFG